MDLRRVIFRIKEDCVRVDCLTSAGALAFFSILAMLPISMLTVSILSLTPWGQAVASALKHWVFSHLMVSSAQKMEVYMGAINLQSHVNSWKSYVLLMMTSVFMMFSIEAPLNRIWRVKHGRSSILGFLTYAAMFLLFPMAIVLLFVVQTYVSHLYVHFPASFTNLWEYVWVSSLFMCTFLFSLLYYFVPSCDVPYKWAVMGGAVASFCFFLSKSLFSFYFYSYSSYPIVYGALSAIPAFLLWIFIAWVIILFGAVVAYVLATESQASS
jgi:membrane protein